MALTSRRALAVASAIVASALLSPPAVAKLIWPAEFADAIDATFAHASPLARVAIAAWIPWLELTVAVAVWLAAWRPAAARLGIALGIAFAAWHAVDGARAVRRPCGCMPGLHLSPAVGLVIAIALTCACAALAWSCRASPSACADVGDGEYRC